MTEYNWKDQWDWDRIRKLMKTQYEKLKLDLRIAQYNLGNKYTTSKEQDRAVRRAQKKLLPYELKEIEKIKNDLIKKEIIDPFNTTKKDKKWSLVYDRHNGGGKIYISKVKKVGGTLKKEYLGKSWPSIMKKIETRARTQVWGDSYAELGLSPWQIDIYEMLTREVTKYPYNKDIGHRDPLLQKYIEQFQMRCVRVNKDKVVIMSKPIKDTKRILDNLRKVLARREKKEKALKQIKIEQITPEPKTIAITNKRQVSLQFHAQ